VHNHDDDHEGPSPEVLPSACFQPEGSILPARRKGRSSLYVPVMAEV
jgi:hypothetical protein